MADLMTVGLTSSLLTAYNHAKLAEKPMMQASNELRKRNPDMGKIQRGMQYGSQELSESEEANHQAGEELDAAQKLAGEEEKINAKERLEEKSVPSIKPASPENKADKITGNPASESETTSPEATERPRTDRVEISQDALKFTEEKSPPKLRSDTPKVYAKTGSVKAMAAASPKAPKINVRA